MGQLSLRFRDDEESKASGEAFDFAPTPAETAILRELAEEEYLASLTTPEARQRHFARLAAEERRRAAEARRISH